VSFFEFLKWLIEYAATSLGGFGVLLLVGALSTILWLLYKLIRYCIFMVGVLTNGWPEGYCSDSDEEDDDEDY